MSLPNFPRTVGRDPLIFDWSMMSSCMSMAPLISIIGTAMGVVVSGSPPTASQAMESRVGLARSCQYSVMK